MANAQPLDGDNPYEILGAARTESKKKILSNAETLKDKKNLKIKQAKGADNEEEYKQLTNEVLQIKDAIDWVEKNHPVDGHPEPTDLDLTVENLNPVVGEQVKIKITSDDGPESGIDIKSDKGQSAVTDNDGRTSMSFDTVGKVQIQTNEGVNYESDSATINVTQREVSLRLVNVPTEIEVNKTERIQVKDRSGNGVGAITILADGDVIDRTDKNGYAELKFDSTGKRTIEASAKDTENISYDSDSVNIEITEEKIPLNLKVNTNVLKVNEPVTFRVVDDQGDGVRDALVSASDGPDGSTNSDGDTTLEFKRSDTYDITVSKDSNDSSIKYLEESVQFRVHKGDAELQVGDTAGAFEAGKEAKIQITDSTGTAVSAATVTTNHGHEITSGEQGWVTLSLNSEENLELTATKESNKIDYDPVNTTFKISENQPVYSISGAPDVASPGEEIRVKIVNENDDPVSGAMIHSARRSTTWETTDNGEAVIKLMDEKGVETLTADRPNVTVKEQAEKRILIQ
jgi:hypothetical protein